MQEGTVMDLYLKEVFGIIQDIHDHEKEYIPAAAYVMVEQVKRNHLVHIFGLGSHSNLTATEAFFRAGGLIHMSAMLNQDTMFSCDVLKSIQIERLPGFGRIIVSNHRIGEGNLLIVVNAYGTNSVTIDVVLQAKENGATVIGVSSHEHAENCPKEHPARRPSKKGLHEAADYAADCKIRLGDAIIKLPDFEQKTGVPSTFVNAYVLNSMMIETIDILNSEGIKPPVWMSGNAPGGDERNNRFMQGSRNKIRCL